MSTQSPLFPHQCKGTAHSRLETMAEYFGVTSVIDVLERFVNRWYERHDLIQSNRRMLDQLQEMYSDAEQLVRMLEDNPVDRNPLYNNIIQTTLRQMETKLQTNKNDLSTLEDCIRKAKTVNRVKRMRDVLLRCNEDVAKFYAFMHDKIMPSITDAEVTDQDRYISDCNVPLNPPRLTLDYDTQDTAEGNLKATIMEKNNGGVVAVVASGMGGVGKTCALRGLAKDSSVKERFPGGVLYIELGNDAGVPDLINGIARIIQRTGGKKLAETIKGTRDLKNAVDEAALWFKQYKCLFLVDDIWKTNDITSDIISIVGTMLHGGSLLVYTTRDEHFLERGEQIVRFEVQEPRADRARRMLLRHAGFENTVELSAANREALNGILDTCNGLPLAIGIAGSTIWTYRERKDGHEEDVLTDYFQDLQSNKESILNHSAQQYGSVSLIVANSLEILQSTSAMNQDFGRFFRAFCVLKKQQRAHGNMLQKLWDLECFSEAWHIASLMHDVSLARMVVNGRKFYLKVHDLVIDIATRSASEKGEVKTFFSTMLDNYMPKEQGASSKGELGPDIEEGTGEEDVQQIRSCGRHLYRPWWCVADDGYIVDNLCRALQKAEEPEELVWLLERAQWIVMRMQTKGIIGVEEDMRVGEKVARTKDSERVELLKYFNIVRSATRMSCDTVNYISYEAWFQLYGRVAWYGKHCERTRILMDEIERFAPRPWVKPSVGFLSAAGGAAMDSVTTTHEYLCVSHGKDVIRAVQAADNDNEYASVLEYDRRYGSQKSFSLVTDENSKAPVNASRTKSGSKTFKRIVRCSCAVFSKDMKRLITGYEDNSLIVWNAEDGYEFLKRWDGQLSKSSRREVKTAGQFVCTALRHLLCVEGGCESGSNIAMRCLAMSGDGSKLLCGLSNGSTCVRNLATGDLFEEALEVPAEEKIVPQSAEQDVQCVAISSDGSVVAFVSKDGKLFMWDANSGKAMAVPYEIEKDKLSCVAVSENGKRVTCGSQDGMVLSWDVDGIGAENLVRRMEGHSERVICIALNSTGRMAASGSADRKVCVWDTKRGVMMGEPLVGHTIGVTHLAMGADCREIISASSDMTLRVWDITKHADSLHEMEPLTSEISSFHYEGNGRQALLGLSNGDVRWLDVDSGKMTGKAMQGHTDEVHIVAQSGDGRRVVSAARDLTVRMWNASSAEAVGVALSNMFPFSVALSYDGRRAAFSSGEKLYLCDMEKGSVISHTEPAAGRIWSCALSSDESRVASGSEDNTVRVWDIHTWQPVGEPFAGHADWVMCVAWSADGKRIVSGSKDSTVRVWDVESGKPICVPFVHSCWINVVQANEDGSRVVSVDGSGYGRLWNVTTGQCEVASSHSEWAQTVRRFGLDRCDMYFRRFSAMKVLAQVGQEEHVDEQVVATSDKPIARVGNRFFTAVHGSSSVPYCDLLS